MKKSLKITFITCLCLMFLTLTGCSSFNKIKGNFEDAGYTYNEELAKAYEENKPSDKEGNELECQVHIFAKNLVNYAVVFEFKTSKDLNKAINEDEDLKKQLEALQDYELVRGNCLLLPIGLSYTEMIELFNK